MMVPGAAPTASPNNRRAQTSLIAGIVAWVLWVLLQCFSYTVGLALAIATFGVSTLCVGIAGYLPVIPWIVAVVTGHMAIGEIGRTGEGGRGFAIAGLIMGYLGAALTVCTLLMWLLVLLFGVSLPFLQGVLPTAPPP